MRSVPGLLTRNERVVVFLETEGHGPVAVVLVGAANVGRISLAFTDLVTNSGGSPKVGEPPSPVPLARGAELGTFNLGSTVVLLLADNALVPAGAARPERLHPALPQQFLVRLGDRYAIVGFGHGFRGGVGRSAAMELPWWIEYSTTSPAIAPTPRT